MIDSVKLNKLRLSPINVRKVSEDRLRLDELTPDVEARGILQNMLVTPAKPKGTFEVLDGGRRWRALMRLVEAGSIVAADYDVPVRVITGDIAHLSETSFAATYHQLPLTPAEECRAYEHFVGKGADIDGVAKRFGKTRRFVEGRLRLASLAEPIFDALASGAITLDIAKAYASTESHDKQLDVWSTYGQNSYVNADSIRRVIANDALKSNEPIALLIGEDCYAAAGGRVDRDLFSEGGDRWIDPEIAKGVAAKMMEAEAKRIGEESGLAWIRPIASSYAYNHAQDLYRVMLDPPELTDEQAARLEAIEARRSELEELMQDEALDEDQFKALDSEDDALMAEAEAIENRLPVLPDELKPHVGAFLLLTPQGEMRLDTQFFSEQPIQRIDDEAQGEGEEDDGEGGEEGERLAGGFRIGGADKEAPSLPEEAVGPGGKPLSARLYDELAMQRRDILAASLLAEPALALDYALFTMIDARSQSTRHTGYHSAHYGSTLRAGAPQDPISGDMPVTRARQYLAEAHDGLDAAWTEPADIVERFEAFRALGDDAKAAWLAYIVAVSLEAKGGFKAEQIPLQNRLASILEIDVAAWWRPTAENFFDRVNKGTILTLLNDVGRGSLTARHATLKKGEIAASCEKLFAGESIVEPDVKEAALAWVPNAMRFLDRVPEQAEGLLDAPGDLDVAESDGADDSETDDGDAVTAAPTASKPAEADEDELAAAEA
ncbi:ParB/RepB/Spo0J family partition protein [Novosphingobium sp. YAF33]|uniref:ParB/RepB/Spo0J family partition protein n=1 Tax=Novosphingobium sp. YAF33 TaxID=3233082 RepID=UPI003F9B562D